jgi:Mg2+-importing ATPase
MGLIQRFMFDLGPLSSLYDFLAFAVLLGVFRAGWFIESLATQTLVVFVIRTAGNPFRGRPSRASCRRSSGALAGAYLALVQVLKRRFYPASGWEAG